MLDFSAEAETKKSFFSDKFKQQIGYARGH